MPLVTAGPSFSSRLAAVLAGELVSKACVMGAFLWLARTVDPGVYGEVEWALSLTMVFTLAADAGLSTVAAAQVAAKPDGAATFVARVGWLRLMLAVPAYLLLLVVAWSYGGHAGTALAVYGLVLFASPLFLQYLFNGLLRPHWAALGQVVRSATFALVVVLFVKEGSPSSSVALAEVLGALALAMCSFLVMRYALRLRVPIFEHRTTRRAALKGPLSTLLTESWATGASEVTWGVHWYAGLILLGYLATTTDAAWHSAGLRLVMAIHTIVWLYLYALLPNLARMAVADADAWARTLERSLRVTAWIGCGIALTGTLAAGTILTSVFGPPFTAAVPVFRAAIWIVPIAWMSGHFRYSLIAAQHPRRDYHAALAGAGTTIVLTLLLVPPLRSLGAGLALLGGTIANAAAAHVLARGVVPHVALRGTMAPSATACLVCLLLGAILTPVAGEIVSTLAAVAALGAAALVVERHSARRFLHRLSGSSAHAST